MTESMIKERSTYSTGILGFTHSNIVSIKKTVAGSGFAPQAIAYSIIPAEPFEVINLNKWVNQFLLTYHRKMILLYQCPLHIVYSSNISMYYEIVATLHYRES